MTKKLTTLTAEELARTNELKLTKTQIIALRDCFGKGWAKMTAKAIAVALATLGL